MKALTLGGAMIDTIAVIAAARVERMTMRNADTSFLLLEEGCKNEAEDISTHCGGGAVNAAVSMARLGHDVSALVKLGQDARADTILSCLSGEGVSTRFALRDPRAPTGASVLVSAHDRNAAIFTFRGANTLLEAKDLSRDAFAVNLVYVAGLSNKSADCFPHIIAQAKASGALIAANPGIRQLSARPSTFHDGISAIDIVSLNLHEAQVLVPWLVSRAGEGGPALEPLPGKELPDLARRGLSAGGFEISLARFFDCLRRIGPKWIVITDGRNGAYVGTPSGLLYCPAPNVTVMGTAGAGDAFNSTFAACICQGASARDATIAASLNASSVIRYLDTQSGLLRRDELEARAAEEGSKIELSHWTI